MIESKRYQFAPHGGGAAYWKDSIFWVEPEGMFNIEGLVEMEARMRALIKAGPSENWVRVELYHDKDTFGPSNDADRVLQDHMQFTRDSGCDCIVLIGCNLLIRETLEKICAKIQMPFRYYETLAEAQQWLTQEGYLIES